MSGTRPLPGVQRSADGTAGSPADEDPTERTAPLRGAPAGPPVELTDELDVTDGGRAGGFTGRMASARRDQETGGGSAVRESTISRRILAHLNERERTFARKVHQNAVTGGSEPDIDGCCEGRALKFEVKRPGQQPTDAQLHRLRQWQAAGALVGWGTCVPHLVEILAHVHDPGWVNPLTGPGDPGGGATRRG